MSDAVTVTYEPQSTPTPTRSKISFSPQYARTLPGILKIVEIVSIIDQCFSVKCSHIVMTACNLKIIYNTVTA